VIDGGLVAGFAHASVLAGEVIEHLAPRDHGVYVDGTLGGAGHATAILVAADTRLIGIDRDPTALAAAAERLARFGDRVNLVHGQFGDVARVLDGRQVDSTGGFDPRPGRLASLVDGILLDLGVSSPQLDVAERGFSFARPGPLDMRMDPTRGPTALDLIHDTDVEALGDLIFELGEERYAKRVARLIKEALREHRIHTTTELASVVAQAIPVAEQRKSKIHPATRTFQALRIAVNGELDQLQQFLEVFPDLLVPGGRCAIISFHSLEDRMVKQRFRDLAWTTSLPPRLAADAGERVEPVCTPVTRKAVVASDAEIATNPRARSARLRVCERTAAPNVPATLVPGAANARHR
jgi:16S rRNA (cytosine1402-N4)-methyltransferase